MRATIVRKVVIPPEELKTQDQYFLMVPIEETGRFDDETTAIVWATRAEAEELISMTEDPERRARDLRILRFAFETFTSANGTLPFCQPDPGRDI